MGDTAQPTLTERVARLEEFAGWDKQPETEYVTVRGDCSEKAAPTAFEEILSRIHMGSERVLRTAAKLETIGSRVMGILPEQAGDGTDSVRIEPDGTLDHTLLALNRLDASFARLESAALRLERI